MKKRKKLAIISIILVIIFLPFTCYKEVKANAGVAFVEGLESVSGILGALGISTLFNLGISNDSVLIGTCSVCGENFYYNYASTGYKQEAEFYEHEQNCNGGSSGDNNNNKKIWGGEALYGKYLYDVMTDKQKEDYENAIKNGTELGLSLSLGQLDEFRDKVNSSKGTTINTTVTAATAPSKYYVYYNLIFNVEPVTNKITLSACEEELKSLNYSYVILYNTFTNSYGDVVNQVILFWTKGSITLNNNTLNFPDGYYCNTFGYREKFKDIIQDELDSSQRGLSENDFRTGTYSADRIIKIFDSSGLINSNETKEIEIVNPDIELKPGTAPMTFTVPAEKVQELSDPMYNPDTNTFQKPVENIEDLQETVTKIENTSSNDINDTDVPERANLDFSPLYADLSKKFPFCIPFDLFNLIDSFSAESERPSFTITFPSIAGSDPVSFEFNFDDYYVVIQIFRYFVLSAFVVGLIVNTKKILGGS